MSTLSGVSRLSLLVGTLVTLLPACAVETSPSSPISSSEDSIPSKIVEPDLLVPRPTPRCLSTEVPMSGSFQCDLTPSSDGQAISLLYGAEGGSTDPSYASSCTGQAAASATFPACSNTVPTHQFLELEVVSGLDNSSVPASECTASYIDYQVRVQLSGSQAWTEWSGRNYGVVSASGRCALAYDGPFDDSYAPENIMAAEMIADSYAVISGPSFHIAVPQSLRFSFNMANSPE